MLKQYKSPTGPNKFSRGVTPTNTDQRGLKVEVDGYNFDTNSSKKFMSLSHKATQKSSETYILAKGNNSSESELNATKVVHDLYDIKTNSYTMFEVNISKDCREYLQRLQRKVRKTEL